MKIFRVEPQVLIQYFIKVIIVSNVQLYNSGEGNTTPYNTHLTRKHHSIQHPPEKETLIHTTHT